jgi:predicted transcriptional regulator
MRDPNRFTATLTARCDPKLAEAVARAARRDFSRPSDIVRRAVAEFLKRAGLLDSDPA